MSKFDTNVQLLKYEVLKEVIKKAYDGTLNNAILEIPKKISPGPKPTMRCCVYKERAILAERVNLAMGGNKENENVVEVIDSACDECPIDGIYVTPACRGCITHKCAEVCPKKAITVIDSKAVVDKSKCIECGLCTKACPYGAIIKQHRPCMNSCKVGAITMDENRKAKIDNSKCISCGACIYQCPFGAISDKSLILDIINILKESNNNENYKVYAVIAPSIVSQFKYAKIEQIVTGIKKLGFHQVVEAALGADITLYKDACELKEKGKVTTSCCPAFVRYIENEFPELKEYISTAVSPMCEAAALIKKADKTAKVIFIGPCSAKKFEYKLEKTKGLIDSVMSFEELQAFLDAREIDASTLEESSLDNASFYGRIFAKSGGIKQGITELAKELGVENVEAISMSGIPECKVALLKLKLGQAKENFFEGMACEGGCINGALCLHHGPKNAIDVDKYGMEAKEKDISNSLKLYNM